MTKSIKIARLTLFLLLSSLLIVAVKNCSEKPYLPGMSPEQVMDDTLQMKAGQITDSVGDGKVIYQGWKKVEDSLQTKAGEIPAEDSIVKYNNISLLMYHGATVVAIRPNKTWPWFVLDSAGHNIAVIKAKRRDEL